MNPTPRPASFRSSVRRGFSAAGAAVVVAFVGTAGLGAAQAQAAGVSTGLSYAAEPAPRAPAPATSPVNLPPATTLAVRYTYQDGALRQV